MQHIKRLKVVKVSEIPKFSMLNIDRTKERAATTHREKTSNEVGNILCSGLYYKCLDFITKQVSEERTINDTIQ